MRVRLAILVTLAALTVNVRASSGAATLDYRGTVIPRREAERLLEPALAAPRDSAVVANALAKLVARLENGGWLAARATARLDTLGGERLEVEVREGARARWSRVALAAAGPADSALLARGLGLVPGGVASPAAASEAIDRVLRNVVDHGHPYAQLGVGGWEVSGDSVSLRLAGTAGPLVTVTRARIEGLRATRPRTVAAAIGRLAGAPYDRAAAVAARDRLAQLGLFRSVTFEGLEGEADWTRGQLVYRVVEPAYNRFEGVVGVQGDAGTVGRVALELGNLLGTGRSSAVRWEARGRGLADFEARYREPFVLGTPVQIEGRVGQQVQDTIFTRTSWGARASLPLSGQERLEAGYEQERVVQEHGELERAQLQNTVFALERTTLDDVLAPRRGTWARLEAAQTFKTEILRPRARRTARASEVELHAAWHRPLRGSSGFTVEIAGAGRFSSQRVLPLFERHPLGGAATLRGHDEEEFRVDRYALSRLEWRWFLGGRGQRAFVFWDHAWMQTRLPIEAGGDRLDEEQADGVGLGLRLEAAGGLVGIDYGLAPGRSFQEGKIHLQLVSTF